MMAQSAPHILNLQNYPPVSADHFIANGIYLKDPVIHASLRTNVGFCWSEVPNLVRITGQQREILAGASRG